MSNDLFSKNYKRDKPTFANINLLGTCNIDCYFCLGKDLPEHFKVEKENVHFEEWPNFSKFLLFCTNNKIQKIYLTGQNTDPCMYPYLKELIYFLQEDLNFKVGIRTNGYGAIAHLDTFNSCKEEIGYSINSLDYNINRQITGVYELPDWDYLIPRTNWCRASIVINRYNFIELMDMIKYLSKFDNLRYIQLRRISTETRQEEMIPDVQIFESVYQSFKKNFGHQITEPFMGAEVFNLFGKQISFWRTVKTNANSFNYYTDGIFTDEYFIIEGYLNAIKNTKEDEYILEEVNHYQEGYEFGSKTTSLNFISEITKNPYSPGCEAHREWVRGYREGVAQKEMSARR